MSSGANLKGFDDVLRNIEMHLGDTKVKRLNPLNAIYSTSFFNLVFFV